MGTKRGEDTGRNTGGNENTSKPIHRWVDNIRMNAGEKEWCVMDWVRLAQDRNKWRVLVNVVMHLGVP
jgi:hypothetical protein